MDHELDLLLGTVIDSLTKLAILLHLQAEPHAVFSAEEVAAATNCREDAARTGLGELGEAGLVERFAVGRGRIVRYGAREDERVQTLLARLAERYAEGGESRAEVARRIVRIESKPCERPTPSV